MKAGYALKGSDKVDHAVKLDFGQVAKSWCGVNLRVIQDATFENRRGKCKRCTASIERKAR